MPACRTNGAAVFCKQLRNPCCFMRFYSLVGRTALGSRLRRLADTVTREAGAIFDLYGVDLDPRWFPVFYMLANTEDAAITELARDIGQSHAAVSQVVRAMVRRGLVKTERSARDSRVTCASLTEKGRSLIDRLDVQCRDVDEAVRGLFEDAGVDFWSALEAVDAELERTSMVQRVRDVRKQRESSRAELVPFSAQHAEAFKQLNLAWIRAHWEPEPADYDALDHPQEYIIDRGGHIILATIDGEVVGTCALIRVDDACYELAKMAVAEARRGQGIGWLVGNAALAKARELGAKRLYLESNTVLAPAINLYRKLGFRRTAAKPSPYARCNIQMERLL